METKNSEYKEIWTEDCLKSVCGLADADGVIVPFNDVERPPVKMTNKIVG